MMASVYIDHVYDLGCVYNLASMVLPIKPGGSVTHHAFIDTPGVSSRIVIHLLAALIIENDR